MNKVTLIFTALRVYRQARSREGSTVRGMITGALAAVAILALGYMGADLSAEQIGMVLAASTGIDAVLKIVLPDQIGGSGHGQTNTAQNLGHADPVGVDIDPAHGADRLRHLPADSGPGADANVDPASRPDRPSWGDQ